MCRNEHLLRGAVVRLLPVSGSWVFQRSGAADWPLLASGPTGAIHGLGMPKGDLSNGGADMRLLTSSKLVFAGHGRNRHGRNCLKAFLTDRIY